MGVKGEGNSRKDPEPPQLQPQSPFSFHLLLQQLGNLIPRAQPRCEGQGLIFYASLVMNDRASEIRHGWRWRHLPWLTAGRPYPACVLNYRIIILVATMY